ncbi:phosphatase PAP2 family protein [Planococcus sp. 107-1]|uniref:phosphatase PAP2 family protein n=1 Tax=Planococcus sp. 107-1 TaxID=2908840 RepID=UPI001F215B4E|nr:phosphatase PAP2 family protein [Planococcus sp. 107-1]UJF27363.1 phosphatase PAP2 family protein [Planococcus sp. 107-1]
MKRLFYPLGMATLLGFFAILFSYSSEPFREIDRTMSQYLKDMRVLDGMSLLGDQWVIFAVSIALLLYLWLSQRNYRAMLFVVLSVGAGNALNQLLKHLFERERPDFPHGLESFSFPSGHAMVGLLYLFTAAYFIAENGLSKTVRWIVWIIAIGLILSIGLSRVAGSEHYFSDVLAGWFAGYTWFIAVAIWYESRLRALKKNNRT